MGRTIPLPSIAGSIALALALFAALRQADADEPRFSGPDSPTPDAVKPGSAKADAANAGSTSAEPPCKREIRQLVEKLGSDSFKVRRAAEEALREIGLPARDALRDGLGGNDLQTRRTCRRLLNDVLELDYQRRLASFIADKEGKLEHDLAGWDRFRRLVGDDRQARRLFADMHQEEGPLLVSMEAGKSAAVEALEVRLGSTIALMRHRNARLRTQPSASAVAALLFAVADSEVELPESLSDDSRWAQLAYTQNFRQALGGKGASAAARKILGQWVILPTGKELLNSKLRLATQYKLPEGLTLALDVIERHNQYGRLKISNAIETVGKVGGVAKAARLVPLLDDKSVMVQAGGRRRPTDIQVRDVALGWLVHLTGQDLAEYGLQRAKPIFKRLETNPLNSVSYAYFCFDNSAKRERALAKWKKWREEHALPRADAPLP